MTDDEALEEARRRWGDDANGRHRQGKLPKGTKPYAVGRRFGRLFDLCGQGMTWEDAFADADRRK